MDSNYIPPESGLEAFNCIHCGVYAKQLWEYLMGSQRGRAIFGCRVAECSHCHEFSIWREDILVYPFNGTAEPPNPDMPDEVKKLYEEAASINSRSSRGAAALLRLSVQVLCQHLGKPGKNLNDDIAALVDDGLPERIKKSLDIVRVTGNNAVHPGQIEFDENPQVVKNLFKLLNLIVNDRISEPRKIDEIYDGLPQKSREQIEKRDK